MAKKCIFCGHGGPFTAEHLLPEWIATLIGVGRLQVRGQRLDDPPRTWQSVGSFGQTVNSVCASCNAGWMSDLENLVKPFLARMILPSSAEPVHLSPDEQLALASWLWKTAIVHEHPSGVKYFNGPERRALRHGDCPPLHGVMMWIGTYVGPQIANVKGGPSRFVTPDGRHLGGYLLSMAIGLFAAQLLCNRKLGQTRVRPKANYDLSDAEAMIWPASPDIVWWPMVERLDAAGFDRWHMRWNTKK